MALSKWILDRIYPRKRTELVSRGDAWRDLAPRLRLDSPGLVTLSTALRKFCRTSGYLGYGASVEISSGPARVGDVVTLSAHIWVSGQRIPMIVYHTEFLLGDQLELTTDTTTRVVASLANQIAEKQNDPGPPAVGSWAA